MINLASLPEAHTAQIRKPNFILPQSNASFVSTADGDAEDLMEIESSQLGQAPSFPVLEN